MSGRAFRPSGRVAARLAAIARIEERAIGSVWGVGKVLQSPTAQVDLDAGAGQVTASAARARTGEPAARPTIGAWRAAEARGVRTPVASVAHGHHVGRQGALQGHCVRECVRRARPREVAQQASQPADRRMNVSSTTRVREAPRACSSRPVPKARIRPCRTAIASTARRTASCVWTRPWVRMRSAGPLPPIAA